VNAYKAVLAAAGATPPPSDTTPPATSITASPGGSTVSGTVSVSIAASDNVGVTKVELYLNAALAGTSATSPATFSWNTTAYPNGSYSLEARAYDAAGNVGTSAPLNVSVQNTLADLTAPVVQITSPATGTTVARSTKVYVTASDNVAVSQVDLMVDWKFYATSYSAAAVFSWNTSKLARGSHTLQAVAHDAAGNEGSSSVVTIYK